MSVEFSFSTGNKHYLDNTPQGKMLHALLEVIPQIQDLWYADTFSLPTFKNLKNYNTGTVILYCWWDPADDRIMPHLEDVDLNFIIINLPIDEWSPIPGTTRLAK